MKAFSTPMLRVFPSRLMLTVLLGGLLCFQGTGVRAITLTGANGRAVEFHVIKSATPKGLTAQMVTDGPVIGIPWDKLDLAALEREHKAIHDAYLKTKQGETVELNLDTAAAATMPAAGGGATPAPAPAPAENKIPGRYAGWIETKMDSFVFAIQLPDEPAKGILLISLDDYGHSFDRVAGFPSGEGPWGVFQDRHDLALLTYDHVGRASSTDPSVIDEFVFASKGSGKILEDGIKALAEKSGKPELAGLPIAVYGAGRTGAAFAYNFVQFRPERIIAAVVSKGAFYDADPTPASAAVPVLLIWGEYSSSHEIWRSENHAATILAKVSALNPNWTSGREFRGRSEQNEIVEYFGKQYLMEMVKSRLPGKKTSAAPTAEPAAEGAGDPEGAGGFGLIPLDRAKGLKGNVETGEVTPLTDPGASLAAEETFLPNDAVAKLWKGLVLGELEPPQPDLPK